MEIPSSLISGSVSEGDIFYFTPDCPVGHSGHMHICIKRGDVVLLFTTCTSQTNTVYNLIRFTGANPNTYPCFAADEINKFSQSLTYVNCNDITALSFDDFSELIRKRLIKPLSGVITEDQMSLIINGVKISDEVSQEIKDMF